MQKAKGHHIRGNYFFTDPLLPQDEKQKETADANSLGTKASPNERTSKSYGKWADANDQWLAWNPVVEKPKADNLPANTEDGKKVTEYKSGEIPLTLTTRNYFL